VCHDFEDAVSAGVVPAADLPPIVRERCGLTRGAQLEAFIGGVVDATIEVGQVGMLAPLAEALAAFRSCNYERIYLRPESIAQAIAVKHLLQALCEHLAGAPALLPPASAEAAGWPAPGSAAAWQAAVTYVAGMTDRYALRLAERWLGWETDELQLIAATT
jgi:dGTPase